MKNNPLIGLMMAIVFLNAAFTAWLAYKYSQSMRTLQTMQAQSVVMNREMNMFRAMVNDSFEYSRKNPAMDNVLQTIGITKTNKATAMPGAPIQGKK